MPKMTIHVPDDIMERLRKSHPDINWAAVARATIIIHLERLEKFDSLIKRGEL